MWCQAKMNSVLGLLGLVGFVGLVGLGDAQLTQAGQCETLTTMTGFTLDGFTGTWLELGKESATNADCSTLAFTSNAGAITVSNPSVVNNFLQTSTGTATQTTGTAIFTLTMTSATTPFEFRILNTDYTNYAVAYNCTNVGTTQRSVNIWLLGRTTTSLNTAAVLNLANAALESFGTTVAQLPSVDHSDDACTQLPVIAPGQPIVLPGQCPTVTPIQNFRVADFVGRWHEISSYHSDNAGGTCARADYTLAGTTVNVVNSQVLNQRLDTISGTATLVGTNGEGRLSVVLNVQGTLVTQELLIIDTDYSGYAVSYTCVNLDNNQRRVNSWILSNTQQISAASQAEVTRVLGTLVDLNTEYYQQTLQTDAACFYYPVHQPGVPVVFPGQCDESLPVQTNFNPEEYMGVWHDIESYPSTFQQGTCNNAYYSLSAVGFVDVHNTEVVNQRLSTIDGIATIPDPSQPAKLVVNFPIDGTTQSTSSNYWVMATDYQTYSLVYSCTNLQNNERSVFSWKLGREKTLPAAAVTAINNAMANIDVLNNDYFEARDQSVAGCFYYPQAVSGRTVVFPGTCDNTIAAQPSFNFQQFSGPWYEVEAYPKEDQTGTCVRHDFTTGTAANTLNLVSNQVVDERLTASSGNVVLESTDGSGRLRLSMTVNGQAISFPYWVLDTDYNNYALVYSCEDIITVYGNFRTVHSWKLSRSQTLSAAANTAINTAMVPVQVLEQEYFESVGQTNNDCFYYPVFTETPESIILPGSCPAIAGKPNFVPANYLGQWYDVAGYPIPSQNIGTCSRAEYSLVDGVITIRNTMVVDGELQTQMGIARLSATGTGLLTVTFVLENGDEVVSTYYILETDYTSFSLVYSCRNLADGRREVFSWKLSRTPTLSSDANNVINNIVSSTQGLLEDYYVSTSQTAEDCFYVPELVPGQAVLFPGACQPVTTVTAFDASRYIGWWHEIERYPTNAEAGECTSAEFRQNGNAFQVVETSVDGLNVNETTSNAVLNADGTITITRSGGSTVWHVLATDYSSYSLLYSCETVSTIWGDYRRVWSAKHSQAQSLTQAAQNAINPIIAANDLLHPHLYEQVNQNATACFHYREEAGEQVILPGQCDTGIPVQSNFDVAQFAGTWYQIERYPYPQVRNEGTCVGSRYTVSGNSVTVLNWDVFNGTLNTVDGTATVDAGSATLTVTLPVPDSEEITTTQLRILATDYEDYALAYTCINVNNFQRAVFSWKLSRLPGLSAEANAIIDNIISNTEGLLDEYYVPSSQTLEDCFYVPEYEAGQSVLFRGSCSYDYGMPGFDFPRFLGWWHVVERYPTDEDPGQCNSVDFYQDSIYDFKATELRVDDGVGNYSKNLVYPHIGSRIGFWDEEDVLTVWYVIDTDYENYAVLYTCEYLIISYLGPHAGVRSVKYSRRRELSAADQAAMAPAIDARVHLYQHLYEPVNQTDEACFHYREDPGQRVVLNGQCDRDIPVVAAFNFTRFAGTWYHIQRYPYLQASNGSCAATRLTLSDEGVSVLNWDVVDGTLNSAEGTATVDAATATLVVTLSGENINENLETNLQILVTNYEDFALAYTCVNINLYQRAVAVFKLSRSREMSTAGNHALESYMAAREEFHQPYFVTISHNDECLEPPQPDSAPMIKNALLLMLLCVTVHSLL